jgi:hypothetical protein
VKRTEDPVSATIFPTFMHNPPRAHFISGSLQHIITFFYQVSEFNFLCLQAKVTQSGDMNPQRNKEYIEKSYASCILFVIKQARLGAGSFRGAWCKPYSGIVDPLTAEALALRDGVLFAQARNFRQVVFETDCSELVRLWDTRRMKKPVISPILEEVSILSLGFESFSISFARRSSNNSAHSCARYACMNNMGEEWVDISPVFLQNNLRADCNVCELS